MTPEEIREEYDFACEVARKNEAGFRFLGEEQDGRRIWKPSADPIFPAFYHGLSRRELLDNPPLLTHEPTSTVDRVVKEALLGQTSMTHHEDIVFVEGADGVYTVEYYSERFSDKIIQIDNYAQHGQLFDYFFCPRSHFRTLFNLGSQEMHLETVTVSSQEAVINAVTVNPKYRGQGLGKTLVESIEDIAGGLGIKTIKLEIVLEEAEDFWVSMGYIVERGMQDEWYKRIKNQSTS